MLEENMTCGHLTEVDEYEAGYRANTNSGHGMQGNHLTLLIFS
jgi:hypothetical protein